MNSDTLVGFYGGTGRNQIASQTLAATTETEFHVNTDVSSTTIAVLTVPQPGAIIGSSSPLNVNANSAILKNNLGRDLAINGVNAPFATSQMFDNGHPFNLRLAGVITPASNAANSLTLKVYNGTSKSGGGIISIADTGTESSTAAGSFVIEAELIWDSTSGILYGAYWSAIAAGATKNFVTTAAITPATSVTLATLQFCATATWGNAAGGTVAVSEFSLSQL